MRQYKKILISQNAKLPCRYCIQTANTGNIDNINKETFNWQMYESNQYKAAACQKGKYKDSLKTTNIGQRIRGI